MAKILVFGSSSVYGAWDKEGGWVGRLRKYADQQNEYHEKNRTEVYNQGIIGDSSKNVLERFEVETQLRLRINDGVNTILFQIGGNDSSFIASKGKARIIPEFYKQNLASLLALARKYTQNIAFVGLTLVDESVTNPISWDSDIFYKNDAILLYNDIIRDFCKVNDIPFIDIIDRAIYFCDDGVHQDSNGHQIVFECVREFLKEKHLV
jgi:lysophospholipase L1-like esterase